MSQFRCESFNTKLERQKFELAVIEKALEPNNASEVEKRMRRSVR